MVNNYDRIYAEITAEAEQLAAEHEIDADALVTLAMAIVDLEDQHRVKSIHNIRQRIDEAILATAVRETPTGDL